MIKQLIFLNLLFSIISAENKMHASSARATVALDLSTFKHYVKGNVVGHKVKIIKKQLIVTNAWCKLSQVIKRISSFTQLAKTQLRRQCWPIETKHCMLQIFRKIKGTFYCNLGITRKVELNKI